MSHIFETVTGTSGALAFKFNGQFALKNYNVEIVNGNRLRVVSTSNEMFSLLEADVSEVEINGTVYSDPSAAQLALTTLVHSDAEPVVLTKEKYLQLAEAVQSADRGKILPDTPAPSGGWQPGWYTPGLFENDDPGTNYPNQNNLKAKKGFITKFLLNGVIWDSISYEIPQATQSIVPFSTSTFPLVAPTAPAAPIQRTHDNSIWELKEGETATIADVPGVSDKWLSIGKQQFIDYLYGEEILTRGDNISTQLSSELSQNYIYYLKSTQINSGENIETINFQLHTAGTIDLILLDSNNAVLHTEEKTGVVGNNTFAFSGISLIPKPYFPAIKPKTSKLTTTFPADGDDTDGVWISPTNVVDELEYKIPLNVVVSKSSEESIGGKLNTIQILTKSTTSEIQTQINKTGKINALKKEYLIEDTLIIPDGTHIDGCYGGSVFKHSGFSGELFNITDRENVKIENIVIAGTKIPYTSDNILNPDGSVKEYAMNGITGPNTINSLSEGVSGTYRTDENGFNILRSENLILDSIIFKNLGGSAMNVRRTGKDYIHGLMATKIFISDCHTGIYGVDQHEFSHYNTITISKCQVGQYFDSGNLLDVNSILTRCRIGIIIDGGLNNDTSGFNHAHGTTGMMEIKHHQIAGLAFNNVSLGQLVPNIHMDYANLLINNSNGVEVTGRMGYGCRFKSIGNPAGKSNIISVSTETGVNDDTVGASNSILNVI